MNMEEYLERLRKMAEKDNQAQPVEPTPETSEDMII